MTRESMMRPGSGPSAAQRLGPRGLVGDRDRIRTVVEMDLVGERQRHSKYDGDQQDRKKIGLPTAMLRGHSNTETLRNFQLKNGIQEFEINEGV